MVVKLEGRLDLTAESLSAKQIMSNTIISYDDNVIDNITMPFWSSQSLAQDKILASVVMISCSYSSLITYAYMPPDL